MNILPLLFRSNARATVLQSLFGPHERAMYLTEMTEFTGMASRSIEVELKSLKGLGLLTTSADRSRIYYSANKAHPLYPDLRSMVIKAAGPRGLLQEALSIKEVEFAFLSGCSNATQFVPQDARLFIVHKPSSLDLAPLLAATTATAGCCLAMHNLTLEALQDRLSHGDSFFTNAIEGAKVFVIGREDRLMAALGRGLTHSTPSNGQGTL